MDIGDAEMKILIEESVLRQALDAFEHFAGMRHSFVSTKIAEGNITALRTALDAAEVVEPVAWMYEHDGMVYDASNPDLISTTRWSSCKEPWSETPLYAAPTSPTNTDSPATSMSGGGCGGQFAGVTTGAGGVGVPNGAGGVGGNQNGPYSTNNPPTSTDESLVQLGKRLAEVIEERDELREAARAVVEWNDAYEWNDLHERIDRLRKALG